VRKQRTIQAPIAVSGVSLHGGAMVGAKLEPMDEDSGVVFDVDGVMIPAHVSHVVDTQLATTLGMDGARVRTVEHLLSTLLGMGIDNLCVKVQGDELPVLDGCASEWMTQIQSVGVVEQSQKLRQLHVVKPIEVGHGKRWARLEPGDGMAMDVTIEFDHPCVGRQQLSVDVNPRVFESELAWARTFGFERLVPAMQRMGLVRGGTLGNALVFGDAGPLNEGGLRAPDEPVRHKALDALGDMALLGHPFVGRLVAERPGHGIVFELVQATLNQSDAYEIQ